MLSNSTSSPTRLGRAARFVGAVALGVVGTIITANAWSATAAPGDIDTTFVPTAGCRLLDTRAGQANIGNRAMPLGPGETHIVDVHGDNGECTGSLAIPSDATGVALNATAVGATTASNIRVYPGDLIEPPLLSNLNVTAGASPTPNKVDVQLSPDGTIALYNFKGNVDIVLDVVGYYTRSSLSDIDRRLALLEAGAGQLDPAVLERLGAVESLSAENEARAAAAEARSATADARSTANASEVQALRNAQPFAVTDYLYRRQVGEQATVIVDLEVVAPTDGHITAFSTTAVDNNRSDTRTRCTISPTTAMDFEFVQAAESPGSIGQDAQLSGTRTFSVAAGSTTNIYLVCDFFDFASNAYSARLTDTVLSALFTPSP
ncbi:MAG: hypothetical protein AAFY28_08385 [Actinomycetota bacterium]